MTLSQTELKALHKHSFENIHLIREAKQAGCFCCLEVFPTSAIDEWLPDQHIQTACCPHCSVDSVLADDENVKLSHDLLKQMQTRYFCPDSEIREYRYFNSLAELMHARQTAEENSETIGIAFCMVV
jgi:hypothetical protein